MFLCVSFCWKSLGIFTFVLDATNQESSAFQTAYATGTLSGMLGADDVWVGGTMRARGQKLGLIAEDPGESSFRWVGWYIVRGRSAPVVNWWMPIRWCLLFWYSFEGFLMRWCWWFQSMLDDRLYFRRNLFCQVASPNSANGWKGSLLRRTPRIPNHRAPNHQLKLPLVDQPPFWVSNIPFFLSRHPIVPCW